MRRRFQAAGHHTAQPSGTSFRQPTAPTALSISNPTDTIVLYAKAPIGLSYLDDSPTIEIRCWDADWGQPLHEIAGNATQWWAVDDYGVQVGHGTLQITDTRFNVCVNGAWVGGETAKAGYYQVVLNNGVTGMVLISSLMNLPRITDRNNLAAFFGTAPDRDQLDYFAADQENSDYIIGNIESDLYFTAPQDAARPHEPLISPHPQSSPGDPSPTAADWGLLATNMVAAGHAGAWYEVPTNEPEYGGWSMTQLIAYYNSCYDAIKAADPTAKVAGPDSAGIMDLTSLSSLGTFLAGVHGIDGITNHMENSHQNMSNIIGLRQYFSGIKNQMATSGKPNLAYWNTETGYIGGGWNVRHPRREARARLMVRLVCESYGWSKERQYDFAYSDHIGSGLALYINEAGPDYDPNNPGTNYSDSSMLESTNMHMAGYVLHVLAEALYGTTCTVQNPPTKLNFGTTGGAADSLYLGLHYRGINRDVVVLATNGIESGHVNLQVSATGALTCWDATGKSYTLYVQDGVVRVPVDDLASYLFLPKNTTVSVAPTWWTTGGEMLGAWTNSNQEGGVPGYTQPIDISTVPHTFTLNISQPAKGFALVTSGPAWQTVGCSFTDFDILDASNNVLYHYECASAVTQPIRSATYRNASSEDTHTTFWTSPFGWLEKVDIPAGTVKLRINKTNYGGQADEVGSTVAQDGGQQIRLGAFQVLR